MRQKGYLMTPGLTPIRPELPGRLSKTALRPSLDDVTRQIGGHGRAIATGKSYEPRDRVHALVSWKWEEAPGGL